MSEFHLIDLMSQRDAVREQLKGRSPGEVIAWLRRHGGVSKRAVAGREVFDFVSSTARQATFFFDDGELVFLGDHTAFT